MSLVYQDPTPAAGVHALICGVSSYQFLPPSNTPAAALPAGCFGMRQLTAASRSAAAIARWLLRNARALDKPLASLRVLLSPQPGEPPLTDANGNPLLIERCSRANFVRAAIDWRSNLMMNPDGIALFYFAGHGVQASPRDSVLLMDDFNDPIAGAPLCNAVNTLNLYNGLSVHPVNRPNIAQKQFFFVDACRVLPSQFIGFEAFTAPAIWGIELNAVDRRSAPVFFAAQSGTGAGALQNVGTIFSKALLNCLENDAARLDDSAGVAKWTISGVSLAMALSKCVDALNKQYNGDQAVVVDGLSGNPVLRTLNGPPKVKQSIALQPPEACDVTRVDVLSSTGTVVACTIPFAPNPQELVLDGGFYTLRANVNPPAPFGSSQRIVLVEPTNSTLPAVVASLPAPGTRT